MAISEKCRFRAVSACVYGALTADSTPLANPDDTILAAGRFLRSKHWRSYADGDQIKPAHLLNGPLKYWFRPGGCGTINARTYGAPLRDYGESVTVSECHGEPGVWLPLERSQQPTTTRFGDLGCQLP